MAFDTQTRNALARLTADARNLLVDEFTKQMQGVYGIQPTGQISDIDTLGHLDDEQRAVAGVLRDRIHHLIAGIKQDKKALAEAVDRVIREQAFTILNRFAALRMCEERGIVQQCVGNGVLSKGFQVYLQTAGSGLGEQYERYRTYLFCIFDEIAVDLGILFDRYSTYGMLFPREPALFALLEILNRKDLAHVWVEDEAIGWIYQYFNSKEERQQMRKASAAPRNSRELAVRNQFFTPRYVVEFLSDNTLGRIWYEMRKGDTALKDQCRYMVRRPNEIFLAEGKEPPSKDTAGKDKDLSQEELLKQPVHIPHRPLKDPRQIKMLDPACGSMHFGLYCFDLFETIYSEAWDIAKSGSLPEGADESFADFCQLTAKYATKADFMRNVPAMIIEHNIHGIDIDPRCAQIAGLSLWLRAQKAWKLQGIRPADRPRITKSNIVCAEPMPGDRELLKAFTSNLNPPLLGQIVERVWDAMQLAGEAGSLLKIEEQITDWVADAKTQWKAMPKASQMLLFEPRAAYGTEPSQAELKLDLTGISDEAFWEQAEERIYAALEDYSNQAAGDGNVAQKLFADDAAKGFAFIDLCRKRYDTVVMNPPFGRATDSVFALLRSTFPASYIDIYCCFVEQALRMCPSGNIGAITSRSFLNAITLDDFRVIVTPRISHLIDLGLGVLDNALVEVAATVFGSSKAEYIDLLDIQTFAHKEESTLEHLRCLSAGHLLENSYLIQKSKLKSVPKYQILYKFNDFGTAQGASTFEPSVAIVRAGLNTFDNFRFIRCWWEVQPAYIGRDAIWECFSKGGEFETFYNDVHLVINRANDGEELGAVNEIQNGQTAQSRQSHSRYYIPGLIYTIRSSRGFNVRHFPAECVFSIKGPVVQAASKVSLPFLVAFLNSEPIRGLIQQQANANQYMPSLVKSLPWIEPDHESHERISKLGLSCISSKRFFYVCCEENASFSIPTGSDEGFGSVRNLSLRRVQRVKDVNNLLHAASRECSEELAKIFSLPSVDWEAEGVRLSDHNLSLSSEVTGESVIAFRYLSYAVGTAFGRWDICYATGERHPPELPDPFDPLPACPPGMLQNAEDLPGEPKDVPADYPLRISWPGILVDDENHQEDIVARVEDVLKVIWKDNWENIEQEACEILGIKKLRDYFSEKKSGSKFFADHLSRYSKSRRQAPIYWPLSTESGSYTLWIYYHRLDDQMLFKCVTDFLEPKIRTVSADIERLQKSLTDGGSASDRDELDKLLDFRMELESMKAELLRVAHLPYNPNLNDGVIINAAPLWKLFRLKKWQKACKDCWEKLEAGDYDWAHMAFSIWPDRVREKCRTDKSLAIAHDLEDVYEQPPEKPKKSKGKRKSEPEPEAELNYDD